MVDRHRKSGCHFALFQDGLHSESFDILRKRQPPYILNLGNKMPSFDMSNLTACFAE